jgi:hypothetical protein
MGITKDIFIVSLSQQFLFRDKLKNKALFRTSNFVNWEKYRDTFNHCIYNSISTSSQIRKECFNISIHSLLVIVHDITSIRDLADISYSVIYLKEKVNSNIKNIAFAVRSI